MSIHNGGRNGKASESMMILSHAMIWTGGGAAPFRGRVNVSDGLITAIAPEGDLARGPDVIDCQGRLLTAGLIDCHTHLVFGGHRGDEWTMRMAGADYAEIARAGGGIMSTVRATRAASDADLLATALRRLDVLLADGVTTIEVKSGYGLTIADELRMLRIARRLGELRPVTVKTSFLAAHAVPAEYAARRTAYITEVVIPALHQAHAEGLVDAVDGFCEGIAFSPAEMAQIFDIAQSLGLPVKLHAEQLSHSGGTALAASYGALSADHLEFATAEDAALMARAGTVAVLLPGAFYALRERQAPPVAALRQAGVPMAVASDLNPGTSPVNSLLLAANMACTLFGLTAEEAITGITTHAAGALGLADRGRIAVGHRADLCLWEAESIGHLIYRLGAQPMAQRIYGGVLCAV